MALSGLPGSYEQPPVPILNHSFRTFPYGKIEGFSLPFSIRKVQKRKKPSDNHFEKNKFYEGGWCQTPSGRGAIREGEIPSRIFIPVFSEEAFFPFRHPVFQRQGKRAETFFVFPNRP